MFWLLAQAPHDVQPNLVDKIARTPLSQVVLFVALCTIIRLTVFPKLVKTEPHLRSGSYVAAKFLNEAMDAIIYAGAFVFLLIRPFCIQAFQIPSESMEKTLLVGDYIVANKAIYRYSDPQPGDIIVFKPPRRALGPDEDKDYIKRCIGVPGMIVEVKNGVVYRNNQPIDEPYINEKPQLDYKLVSYHGQYWPVQYTADACNQPSMVNDEFVALGPDMEQELRSLPPVAIPPGHYLMMGDNRNRSSDGRFWGLVPRSEIIGRAEFIWLPLNRWRITR